eukprot:TRINITY_DN2210_c0_g1_i1.p1 TRINITY_DN2210_c0_g1~~TRINITY_DN2210_c0_g1_i1.p1  ORF type:complete len:1618 (+),score=446.07 TRINITY_DN2210_c0_g1_i1:549-5402(+)
MGYSDSKGGKGKRDRVEDSDRGDKGKKGGDKGEKGKKGDKGGKGKKGEKKVVSTSLRGKVVSFINGKPSGFIKRMDGKQDVYFDFVDVVDEEELKAGDPVEYDVVEGSDERLYASNIKKLPPGTVLVEEKPTMKPTAPVAAAKAGSLTGAAFGLGGGFSLGGPKAAAPGRLTAPVTLGPGGALSLSPTAGSAAKKKEIDDCEMPTGPDEDGIEWGRIVQVYDAYGFLQPFGTFAEKSDIFFRASDVIGMNGNDPGSEGNALTITLPNGRKSNGFKQFWLSKDDEVTFIMSKDHNGKPCAAQIYKEKKGGWREGKARRDGGARGESVKDKMKRIEEMDSDEILQNISLFKEVLDSNEFTPANLYKVVAILASPEIAEDMRSDRLYAVFLDSAAMQSTLRTAIIKQGQGKHCGTFLEECLRLLTEIVLRSPSSADLRGQLPLIELVEAFEFSVREGSSITRDGLSEDVVGMLRTLEKNFPDEVNLSRVLGVRAKRSRRTAAENYTELMEAEYYQDMPILPTSNEMLGQCAFEIQENMSTYEKCEDYIQTHFMLLREDYIEPLRAGIKLYMEGKHSPKDLHVYTGVKVVGVLSTWEGLVYRIQLRQDSVRRINWEKTKQLMYGSLLCFSDDNFETLIWATVWRREEALIAKEGMLDIRMPFEPFDDRFAPGKEFCCIENVTIYFEAYRYVLIALQNMRPSDVPFQGTLLPPQPDPIPPLFLKAENDMFHFHNVFHSCQKDDGPVPPKSFKILQDWPVENLRASLDIDPSQLESIQHALTHNMALIQGPPGTGKTWVGLKIVQSLLENTKGFRYSPILVVCYTNHALDQFLEGIFKFNERIARIGSRSKSECLKDRNLKELVGGMQPTKDYFQARRALMERRDSLRERLAEVLHDVDKHEVEVGDVYSGPGFDALMSEKKFQKFYDGYKEYMGGDVRGLPDDLTEIDEDLWDKIMRAWLDTSDVLKITAPMIPKVGPQKPARRPAEAVEKNVSESDDEDQEPEEEEAETMKADRLLDVEAQDAAPKKTQDFLAELKNGWLPDEETYREGLRPELRSLQWRDESNLWRLPLSLRRETYRQWLLEVHHEARQLLPELCYQLERNAEQRAAMERDRKLSALREMDIVGMTTTAVSKYQQLLKELRPEIIIVEEAAEVLEAHILTALHPRTQHVILIGDHQQLRPSTAVYRLSKNFHFDVSLFERLIKNGCAHVTLEQQRRMHPSISRLMKPLYPNLRDHKSVSEYPDIMGVKARTFFLKHPHYEDEDDAGHSKQNSFEANFIAAFCAHLVASGYDESRVTVLSPYLGQVRTIKNKLRRHPSTENMACFAVDNFQGEENDIIILSLVRSNKTKTMGFVAVENRINVALTRARHGMFIVGNADMLDKHPLWTSIMADMSSHNCLADRLPLVQHETGGLFEVKSADEISVMLDDPLLEAGDAGRAGPAEGFVADRWKDLGKDDDYKGKNKDKSKGKGKDKDAKSRERRDDDSFGFGRGKAGGKNGDRYPERSSGGSRNGGKAAGGDRDGYGANGYYGGGFGGRDERGGGPPPREREKERRPIISDDDPPLSAAAAPKRSEPPPRRAVAEPPPASQEKLDADAGGEDAKRGGGKKGKQKSKPVVMRWG